MDDPKIIRTQMYGYPNPMPHPEYLPRKTQQEMITELWLLGECTCDFGFCPNHPKKASESA